MARNTREEILRFQIEADGDKDLAALAGQLGKLSQGSDAAADQAKALVAELEKLASTSANIRQFTTLKASITETGDAIQKAKERMATLGAEVDRTEKPTAKLQAALKRAAADVENLTKQQNRQSAELQRTSSALRATGVDTEQLAEAYENLQGEFDQFGRRAGVAADALERTGKQGKSAAQGVSALDKAAGAGKKSLGEIAAQLTIVSGAATAAIKGLALLSGAALFKGGIQSATTLEQALSEVKAVAGATADEMARLKDSAEEGGATTRFSTLQAAQGLGELARATGSAQAAIAALPAALNLAQAAGLGVAESAQLITTTLTQYGLAADQAARVSDVLSKAANVTTADVQGLGNALSYAAPLAKQLGVDVEGTAAIVGVLADQGFRGERAGTALRNVFSEMLDPASDFAKALRDLGIESTDFVEVLDQLQSKGKRGQDALLKLDAAARPAILSLVNSGGAALRQLDAELRNAAGSAEETARVMGDNLGGAFEDISDTFDRTRRSLVEPLLEPLKNELFSLANQLETFAASPEFDEIRTSLAEMFSEGAAAARDLIQNVDFAELANNIRTALENAGQTMADFKENLDTIVTSVQLIGNAFSLVFNGVQAAILLVAGALAKLAAAGALFGEAFTGPARKFAEFLGLIEEGSLDLTEIAGGLNAVGDEFGARFAENLDESIAAAQALAGTTVTAADAVGAASAAGATASGAFSKLAPVVVTATQALDGEAAAASRAAGSTAAAAAQVEKDAERLKKAFADMGITAQADLQRAAESARRNFDLIRAAVQSGQATAEDARRAFSAYAEAQRAAVADSDATAQTRVENELRVSRATLGVAASLKEMGDAGVEATARVSAGSQRLQRDLAGVGSAADSAGRSTGDVATSLDKTAKAADAASEFMGEASKEGQLFALAMYEVSKAAIDAYMDTNRYAGMSDIWRDKLNTLTASINAQGDALRAQVAEIEKANGAFDELAGRREALQKEFNLLGPGEIERLLQAEQRLEQNRKASAEAAKRDREERLAAVEAERAARFSSASDDDASTSGINRSLGVLKIEIGGQSVDLVATPQSVEDFLRALGQAQSVNNLGFGG